MGNSNNDKELNDAYNNPEVSTSDLLNMISGRMNKKVQEVATVTPSQVQIYIDEYNKAKTEEQKGNVLQAAKAAGIEVATIKVDEQSKSMQDKINIDKQDLNINSNADSKEVDDDER